MLDPCPREPNGVLVVTLQQVVVHPPRPQHVDRKGLGLVLFLLAKVQLAAHAEACFLKVPIGQKLN